ncbi:MAG: hypothetical protein IPP44_10615 [Ideonella sp.]|nr:hypothetical protein [Ideonella sp.]
MAIGSLKRYSRCTSMRDSPPSRRTVIRPRERGLSSRLSGSSIEKINQSSLTQPNHATSAVVEASMKCGSCLPSRSTIIRPTRRSGRLVSVASQRPLGDSLGMRSLAGLKKASIGTGSSAACAANGSSIAVTTAHATRTVRLRLEWFMPFSLWLRASHLHFGRVWAGRAATLLPPGPRILHAPSRCWGHARGAAGQAAFASMA